MTVILLFIVGLVLLIKGGDLFVDSATNIAHRFHVPELIVGATIVSIGTTLPEVMVSATSALSGHGEIAYGNAIGSVICNTSLIAAITIAVRPCEVERKTLRLPVCFFFLAAALYAAAAYLFGNFSRTIGIILLGMFFLYLVLITDQTKRLSPGPTDAANKSEGSGFKDIVLLVVSAGLIAIGARLLVDNGTRIAQALGVPESVIGLTVVALGTSLPELSTAITSLIKGHGSLSLGNIIGANLFNLVLVSGVSVTLSPFEVPHSKLLGGMNASLVLDIPLMFFVMAFMTVPALVRGKLSRVQGIVLLLVYAAFCVIQFYL